MCWAALGGLFSGLFDWSFCYWLISWRLLTLAFGTLRTVATLIAVATLTAIAAVAALIAIALAVVAARAFGRLFLFGFFNWRAVALFVSEQANQ